jgi:hypothetical protein
MATFTITTTTNYESLIGAVGNDTYNINGGTLIIDTDTRYCANHTATTGNLGTVTISSSLGGTLKIDARGVRIIPFNSGSGNVPAIGTTISQGSVSAYLLGVWSALNAAPTAAGAAMPTSGYIKVKNKTGGNFTSGALSGIGANATGPDVVGWIEVVGVEAATITCPRLGSVQILGEWYNVGTTNGSPNQQIQMPASLANTYYPGVWIETSPNSGTYEFYPSAGSATTYRTDIAGKVVYISSQGLLTIGYAGAANNGYVPPSGCKIKVPNIITLNATSTSMNTNAVPNATLATRYDFTTTGGGSITIDKANLAWYPSFTQAYSVSMTNTGVLEQIYLQEIAIPFTLDQVGVGQTAAQIQIPLNILLCLAGGTISNCVFSRYSLAATGGYIFQATDCFNLTCNNVVLRTMVNRASTTSGTYNLTRVNDSTFTNNYLVGAKVILTTCSNLTFTNTHYCDAASGTTLTTLGQYAFLIQSNCANIKIDGLDFWGLTNVHPYAGLFNIPSASSKIKIRNIGSATTPLSLGSTNASLYVLVGAANAGAKDIEIKRVYLSNTQTGFQSNIDNSYNNLVYQNFWTDAADYLVFSSLNMVIKGMMGTNTTAGQTAVYGVHFFDTFTSTTAGRIGIAFNEKTLVEPSASTYQVVQSGTGFGFNSSGQLIMPNLNDEIIYTTPYYIIGHTSFQNVAPTITGTNVSGGTPPTYGNFTFYYQIDKNNGNGYNGTWKGLTAANLSAETGIDASKGFKLKIRIVCTTANTTNALTYITIPTNTNSTAMTYQYPLDEATITLQNVVVGSRYEIYNLTSSTTLVTGTASSSTVSITAPSSDGDYLRIRVRKASSSPKYIPFETQTQVTSGVANVWVSQVLDTIAS